jgi:hypothetical protein
VPKQRLGLTDRKKCDKLAITATRDRVRSVMRLRGRLRGGSYVHATFGLCLCETPGTVASIVNIRPVRGPSAICVGPRHTSNSFVSCFGFMHSPACAEL